MDKLIDILKEIQIKTSLSGKQVWEVAEDIAALSHIKRDPYGRKWRKAIKIFEKYGFNNPNSVGKNIPEWLETASPIDRLKMYKELKIILDGQ